MKVQLQQNRTAFQILNLQPDINWGTTFAVDHENYAFHTLPDGENIDQVTQSRRRLMEENGIEQLITLKQTHSDKIHVIEKSNLEIYQSNPLITGDALITSIPKIALGILTADCVPILIACPNKAVAAVHAGWKGILNEILPQTLQKLMEKFFCYPSEMKVFIGPHSRSCCYEVKEDLLDRFTHPIIRTNEQGRTFLDMEAMIIRQLHDFDIQEQQILSLPHCTQCHTDPEYHSYRREKSNLRNISWIALNTK